MKLPLPPPLVPLLNDDQQLIKIIAETLGRSPELVRSDLREEESDLGKFHREDFKRAGLTPHVWDERFETFYRDTPAPLTGHVVWNRRSEKLKMRAWVGEYLARGRGSRLQVLAIGDGTGFDSLYLAQCGHDVTYFELAKDCITFAQRIFDLAGQPVKIVVDTDELASQSFDVVLCLDVLEHVPNPPEFVRQLASYLRPGGRMIVHAPFFYVTYHNPTHLRANQKYSGDLSRLYTQNGLHLVDGSLLWDPLVLQKADAHGQAPRLRRLRVWMLRAAGCLLAVARFWSFPHNLIAAAIMKKTARR
ncbi:MAG: methyltransferase domain-containing protein [Pirellulales bacterium]|nr:methyltransferase domain-containing protein [Pirellulales bacterium]